MSYVIFALILGASLYYFVRTIYKTFSGKATGCSCAHADSCALSKTCSSKNNKVQLKNKILIANYKAVMF